MYTHWLINVNKTDFHLNLLILGLFTCVATEFAGRPGTSGQYRFISQLYRNVLFFFFGEFSNI